MGVTRKEELIQAILKEIENKKQNWFEHLIRMRDKRSTNKV